MTLLEFLQLPHRFGWGGANDRDDCLTFMARWIEAQTGVDPAASLRGTYRSAEQAYEIIDEFGGIVALVDFHVKPVGFHRTDTPGDGDIAIVRAPAGMVGNASEIGAIRFGPLWASLGEGGVIGKKLDFVAAWSFSE